MKLISNEKFFTIGEVGRMIERQPQTIKIWYEWYAEQSPEEQAANPLPAMLTNLDERGTRYFRDGELSLLFDFKDSISRGKLALTNRKKWGKRG